MSELGLQRVSVPALEQRGLVFEGSTEGMVKKYLFKCLLSVSVLEWEICSSGHGRGVCGPIVIILYCASATLGDP